MSGFKDSVKQILAQVFGRADYADVLEDTWDYSDTFEGEVVDGMMPARAESEGRAEPQPRRPIAPTQEMTASPAQGETQRTPISTPIRVPTEPMETLEGEQPEATRVTVENLAAVTGAVPDALDTGNLIAQIAFDNPAGLYPEHATGSSPASGQVDSIGGDDLSDLVAGAQTTEALQAATDRVSTTRGPAAKPTPLLLVKKEAAKAEPLLLKNAPGPATVAPTAKEVAPKSSEKQQRQTTRSGRSLDIEDEEDSLHFVRSKRTSSATVIEASTEHAPLSAYDYGVKPPPYPDDLSGLHTALTDSLQRDLNLLGSHREEVIVELLLEALENPTVDLPPFPAAARRLLGTGDASPDDDDILDVVKSDPGLAAQVIKAANSPFYMAAAPVASLGSAVVRIGLREVRRVALAAAMAATFNVDGFEPLVDTSHIHSLTAGTSSEALSKTFHIEPGVAFLAGLLHDAGELLTYRLLGRGYGQGPRQKAPWRDHLPFVRELAKKYHCYLGALFIQPWDLPAELGASLVYHHHPYMAGDDQEELASLIHVANATADVALRHARSDIWQQYLARLQERREQSSAPAKVGSAGVDGIDLLPLAEIMEMLPPGFPRPRIHSIIRDILLRVAADSLKAGFDDATTLPPS